MKYLIDLPPDLEQRARKVAQARGYSGVDHFILLAIENQVRAELGDINPWADKPALSHTPVQVVTSTNLPSIGERLKVPRSQVITLDNVPPRTGLLLWGQYYRFLPVKVGLRALANFTVRELSEFTDYRRAATEAAVEFGKLLSRADRKKLRPFSERLAVSFPDSSLKSQLRYMNQFLAYMRPSDRRLDGFAAVMGWVAVNDEDGILKVGLTQSGLKFTQLDNPAIDLAEDRPLSEPEIGAIIDQLAANLPDEILHVREGLKSIDQGMANPESMSERLRQFYAKYQEAYPWSSKVVDTMRAGLVSRMYELGLVARSRRTRRATYTVTEAGQTFLSEKGQHLGSIRAVEH